MLRALGRWRFQGVILLVVAASTLLGRLGPTGWPFFYVTLMFVVLPVLALAAALGVLVRLMQARTWPERWQALALAVIPALLLWEISEGNIHLAHLLGPPRD